MERSGGLNEAPNESEINSIAKYVITHIERKNGIKLKVMMMPTTIGMNVRLLSSPDV